MIASNTNDCFSTFIGLRVVGVVFGGLRNPHRSSVGSKTIIFEDGRGLTITNDGAFWVESREIVREGIETQAEALKNASKDLKDAAKLFGVKL